MHPRLRCAACVARVCVYQSVGRIEEKTFRVSIKLDLPDDLQDIIVASRVSIFTKIVPPTRGGVDSFSKRPLYPTIE